MVVSLKVFFIFQLLPILNAKSDMLWGKTESRNVRLRNVWRTHTKVRSTQYAEYTICRALVASEKIFTLEINLNMLTAINYI